MSKRLPIIVALVALLALGVSVLLREDAGTRTATDSTPEASEPKKGEASDVKSSRPAPALRFRGSDDIPANAHSAVVTGAVVDLASGEPVSWVDVVFTKDREEASVTSDASGQYKIELAPGSYQVRAVGELVIAKKMPALRIGSAPTVSRNISVEQLATLRGTVVSHEGEGIAGVDVSLREDSGSGRVYPNRGEIGLTASESGGRFELLVPPGAAALEAVLEETTVFVDVPPVASGDVLEGITIVLDQRGVIRGFVSLPGKGVAAGATVLLTQRRTGTSHFVHKEVVSGNDGSFRFDGLAPVQHSIEAIMNGYGSSDPQAVLLGSKTPSLEVKVLLHKAASLSGRVVDSDGQPMSGVRVSQVRTGSHQFYNKEETGSRGTFEFDELSPGPHRLRASKNGYTQASFADVKAPNSDIILTMAPSGALSGTVTTTDEIDLGAFSVKYRLANKKPSPRTEKSSSFVADDGRFQIYPLAAGTYWVEVSSEGFAPKVLETVVVPPGDEGNASTSLSLLDEG